MQGIILATKGYIGRNIEYILPFNVKVKTGLNIKVVAKQYTIGIKLVEDPIKTKTEISESKIDIIAENQIEVGE